MSLEKLGRGRSVDFPVISAALLIADSPKVNYPDDMASATTKTGPAPTNDKSRQSQTQVIKSENNDKTATAEKLTILKPTITDTARTLSPQKARKRTKTGCLSKLG